MHEHFVPFSCAQYVYVCIYVSLLQTKCAQYWSDAVAEPFDVGNGLFVTLLEVRPFADYEVKTFSLGEVSHFKIDVLYIRTYVRMLHSFLLGQHSLLRQP